MENLHPLLALLAFLMSEDEPTIAPIMSIETEDAYYTLFLN